MSGVAEAPDRWARIVRDTSLNYAKHYISNMNDKNALHTYQRLEAESDRAKGDLRERAEREYRIALAARKLYGSPEADDVE